MKARSSTSCMINAYCKRLIGNKIASNICTRQEELGNESKLKNSITVNNEFSRPMFQVRTA